MLLHTVTSRINTFNSIPHLEDRNRISTASSSSSSLLLPNTFLPTLYTGKRKGISSSSSSSFSQKNGQSTRRRRIKAVLETPVLWAGRVCIFYALLKSGLAGSPSNPLLSDDPPSSEVASGGGGGDDLGFSKWFEEFRGKPDREAVDRSKFVSKWHPTTKGTLKRNYRVASKPVGRRLLQAIASMLADDDTFVDATSHKGCQIRRESAHGETVCCNNVRALFDELPTPHLIVEITPFPVGPLTDNDYAKAEKLEKVLRTGPSI